MQSMNDTQRGAKLLQAAYGKMKSSRYETFSDNSKINDAVEEQPVYFGADSSHQKKLISNLS